MNLEYLHPLLVVIFLSLPADAGLLNLKKGLKKARTAHLDGINQLTDDEFIPVRQGLKTNRHGLITFNVPAETTKKKVTYAYIGLGPVPVKEMTKYALNLKTNLKYGFIANFSATFYHGKKPLSFSKIYAQGSADSPPMVESRSVFATPPGTDQMILWIGVGTGGKRLLYPGIHMTFAKIAIAATGKLVAHLNVAKNLLPIARFDKLKVGPVRFEECAFFAGPAKNRPLAKIVNKGNNVLQLKYKKGDYPYPLFKVAKGKYYGSLARFSCRVRGKGRVTPTIWWYRNHVGHYYDGAIPVILTRQWQQIEVFSYCRDASVVYASCAMICRSETVDMDIEKVSFKLIGTDN
jgi:hypothetical protein